MNVIIISRNTTEILAKDSRKKTISYLKNTQDSEHVSKFLIKTL